MNNSDERDYAEEAANRRELKTVDGPGVTVLILPSQCAACGKLGHNYQVDRVCFSLVCLDCLDTFTCPCERIES